MNSLFVKPASDGASIPNPDRMMRLLDAVGEAVPDNAFWRRRLAGGDVVLCDPPAQPDPESESASSDPAPKAGK